MRGLPREGFKERVRTKKREMLTGLGWGPEPCCGLLPALIDFAIVPKAPEVRRSSRLGGHPLAPFPGWRLGLYSSLTD